MENNQEEVENLLHLIYSGDLDSIQLAVAIAKGLGIDIRTMVENLGWPKFGFSKLRDFHDRNVCFLYFTQLDDLQLLSKAARIEHLYILKGKILSLKGLENMHKLTRLCLNETEVVNFQAVRLYLNHLEANSLKADFQPKMDFVSAFPDLELLSFKDNQVDKSDYFANKKRLKSLFLGNNALKEINGLYKMSQLEHLQLNDNQLVEIDLSPFPLLKSLNLDNNSIESLDFLNLDRLETLSVCQNQLTEAHFKYNFELTFVELSYNKLTAFEIKGKLYLKRINLIGNFIQTLHLSNLPELRELNLAFNPLEKLTFDNLPRLRHIQLSNELKNSDVHKLLKTQFPKVQILF